MAQERGTVEIVIDENGSVTIEALDVVGPSCSLLTRELERALGETVKDTKKTEFHTKTATQAAKARA